jgi:uncharacterized membrane protein
MRRVLWMNLCFAAGLALLLPWLAAGVLAHWPGAARGTLWQTHHAYAVRTFWFGVLAALLPLLAPPAVGLPVAALAWLWLAARLVRAFLAWEAGERISDPGRFV